MSHSASAKPAMRWSQTITCCYDSLAGLAKPIHEEDTRKLKPEAVVDRRDSKGHWCVGSQVIVTHTCASFSTAELTQLRNLLRLRTRCFPIATAMASMALLALLILAYGKLTDAGEIAYARTR